MKNLSLIFASLVLCAGVTFAQQSGTMPASKTTGTKTASTSGNGAATGKGTTTTTTVKKVPAAKPKATPAVTPMPDKTK